MTQRMTRQIFSFQKPTSLNRILVKCKVIVVTSDEEKVVRVLLQMSNTPFKEVWIGATFFWKLADILRRVILFACNDLCCGRCKRGSAANFASNSRFIEIKVKEKVQVPAYLLKKAFHQVFPFLCIFLSRIGIFLGVFTTKSFQKQDKTTMSPHLQTMQRCGAFSWNFKCKRKARLILVLSPWSARFIFTHFCETHYENNFFRVCFHFTPLTKTKVSLFWWSLLIIIVIDKTCFSKWPPVISFTLQTCSS